MSLQNQTKLPNIALLSVGVPSQYLTELKQRFPIIKLITLDDMAERLLFEQADKKFLFDNDNTDFIQAKLLTLISDFDLVIEIISSDCSCSKNIPSLNKEISNKNIPIVSIILKEQLSNQILIKQIAESSSTSITLDTKIANQNLNFGFDSPLNIIYSICEIISIILYYEQTNNIDLSQIKSFLQNKTKITKMIIGRGFSGKDTGKLAISQIISNYDASEFSEALLFLVVPQSVRIPEAEATMWTILEELNVNLELTWGMKFIDEKPLQSTEDPITIFGFLNKSKVSTNYGVNTFNQTNTEKRNIVFNPSLQQNQVLNPLTASIPQEINFNEIKSSVYGSPQQQNFETPQASDDKCPETIYIFEEGGLTLAHFPGNIQMTDAAPEAVTGLFEALKLMAKDIVGQNIETILAGNKKIMFLSKQVSSKNKRITGVSIFNKKLNDTPVIKRLEQSLDLVGYLLRQNVRENEMKSYVDQLIAKSPLPLFEYTNAS